MSVIGFGLVAGGIVLLYLALAPRKAAA